MGKSLIDIEVHVLHETEMAWRVTLDDPKDGLWVPKSQCEIEPSDEGTAAMLTLPEWLAIEKGLV